MSKYFSLPRIQSACEHLSQFHSVWVLVPLVFAVNGVNKTEFVPLTNPGTDRFLDKHFNGKLMGLPSLGRGNALRPKFADLRVRGETDYVVHQKQLLWANAYSRTGYPSMIDRGYVEKRGNNNFKLTDLFKAAFENHLPADFHFEELLIWLYAFEGIPDHIGGWEDLFIYFQESYRGVAGRFAPEYLGRFHVNNGVPWPLDFYDSRPSNEDFQMGLIPSYVATAMSDVFQGDLATLATRFKEDVRDVGMYYTDSLITRFIASLCTKPFVILTGLAGSGKTKLAQSFAYWASKDESQLSIVSVGPDWRNNENIFGYPDALDLYRYVKPRPLELMLKAIGNPDKPYFLILDEMNLSHVERYFADVLSALESGESIQLHTDPQTHDGSVTRSGVPARISLPKNLFIIGTVNIDETTYMFSPKVLDRANVIEFRMTREELELFLTSPSEVDVQILIGKGSELSGSLVEALHSSFNLEFIELQKLKTELILFFDLLSEFGAEFGYRVVKEIARFIYFYKEITSTEGWSFEQALDAQVVQKILPKLHGSRKRLEPTLWALGALCFFEREWIEEHDPVTGEVSITLANKAELLSKVSKAKKLERSFDPNTFEGAPYLKLSVDKIRRMSNMLASNGFVSFAEA